jgi:hypothetical protein
MRTLVTIALALFLAALAVTSALACSVSDVTIRETGAGIVHVIGSYSHPGRLYGMTVYVRDAATGDLLGSNGALGFRGGANFRSYVPVTYYPDRYRIEAQCHAAR